MSAVGHATWLGDDGLKQCLIENNLKVLRNDEGTAWYVFAYDGGVIHSTRVFKDGGAEQTDFEASFAAMTGLPIARTELYSGQNKLPVSDDGRMTVRTAISRPGWYARIRSFYFITSTPSSLHNKSPAGTDYGDVTYKCFDGSNVDVTDAPSTAVVTQIDFEANWNEDLIGGWMAIDPTLDGGTTDEWWVSCVGAPDIPAEAGGSIDFLAETNLEMVGDKRIDFDGRSTATIYDDPTYHSGKIRLIFKHPMGGAKRFQWFLSTYR